MLSLGPARAAPNLRSSQLAVLARPDIAAIGPPLPRSPVSESTAHQHPPGAVSRRVVLLAAAVPVAVGCVARRGSPGAPAPDPDAEISARVARAEQALLARYADTVRRHPSLASRLNPLASEHAAHLVALTSHPPGGPSTAASATPTPTSGRPGPAVAVPADAARAVAALATAERQAARARIGDAVAASITLAPVLASIGGAEAAHAALLGVR
jgi:hypothetical protein